MLDYDSQFVLINNSELSSKIGLSNSDVKMLRNDILSKINDCDI